MVRFHPSEIGNSAAHRKRGNRMKMHEQLAVVHKIADLVREEINGCQVSTCIDHHENIYEITAYNDDFKCRMTAKIPDDSIKGIAREVSEFLYGYTLLILEGKFADNGLVMTSLHKWFFGE